MNRRARTLPTIPVRYNHIFDIIVMRDGYAVSRTAYWYARNIGGRRITGPVYLDLS